MTPAVPTLRVWLVSDAPGGEGFLADLCAMLVAVAAKSQCALSFEPQGSSTCREARAELPIDSPTLVRQAGVHRAQLVPASSRTGRVETVLAAVELLAPSQPPTPGRPAGAVLKTYNYALQSVMVHATNERYPLADVLAGNAGCLQPPIGVGRRAFAASSPASDGTLIRWAYAVAFDIEDHPSWKALRSLLQDLRTNAGGENAFVLDASGNVWCSAHSADEASLLRIVGFAETILRAQKPPITRGGKLDRIVRHPFNAYARSFGGAYVVLVPFGDANNTDAVRSLVATALPLVEALTTSLPPPEGPGGASNEGVGVA